MNERVVVKTRRCPVCDKHTELTLDATKYAQWLGGELIQRVFPEWTPAERELLKTGTHPDCWKILVGEDPDA